MKEKTGGQCDSGRQWVCMREVKEQLRVLTIFFHRKFYCHYKTSPSFYCNIKGLHDLDLFALNPT